jgi:hypothetical protein
MKLRVKLKDQKPSSDNTLVKKRVSEKDIPQPKFSYKKTDYTSKDSADYKKGFRSALRYEASQKPNVVNPDRKTPGTLMIVGLNDKFNEGYSEGRDFVLKRDKKK